MKKIVCQQYGPPESLVLVAGEDPAPRPDQVVVAVEAAGVNYVDALMVAGTYQIKVPPPFVPGSELAGRVVAVGSDVDPATAQLGDSVVSFCGLGAYASAVAIPAAAVLRIPAELDAGQAAAAVQSYSTARFALTQRGALQGGQTVAVAGAAGGVGLACIDIARAAGARVIGLASSAAKREAVLAAGADEALDPASSDLKAALRERQIDVFVDPVGGDLTEIGLRALGWGGQLLVIGFPAGVARLAANLALLNNRSIVGVDWGAWALRNAAAQRELLSGIVTDIASGVLRGPTVTPWPLADAGRALRELLDRKAIGKLVLVPE